MKQAREPWKVASVFMFLDPSGSQSVGGWSSKQYLSALTRAEREPSEGSHRCFAERKPRQRQKYLNMKKKRDKNTRGMWAPKLGG